MVNIENLFNNAFCAIKSNPKIMLPFVLNWLPASLIYVTISLVARDIVNAYTLGTLRTSFEASPAGFLASFLSQYSFHIILVITATVFSVFIATFVNAIYPTLSYQIYYRKKIRLVEAVEIAKKRYLRVLWTNIIFIAIILLFIFAGFAGAGFIVTILSSPGGITGAVLTALAAFAAVIIFLVLLARLTAMGAILEALVVIENVSGMDALKRSYKTLNGRIIETLVFLLLLFIANGLYIAMIGWITEILAFVFGDYTAIVQMVLMLLPSSFILLSYGLLYLEISPSSINLSGSPRKTC